MTYPHDKNHVIRERNKENMYVFSFFFLCTTTTAPNAPVLFAAWVISYLLSAGAS